MFISKNELLWFPRPENQKEAFYRLAEKSAT